MESFGGAGFKEKLAAMKGDKPGEKPAPQDGESESSLFDVAVDTMFSALKAGDKKSFKEAFVAASKSCPSDAEGE